MEIPLHHLGPTLTPRSVIFSHATPVRDTFMNIFLLSADENSLSHSTQLANQVILYTKFSIYKIRTPSFGFDLKALNWPINNQCHHVSFNTTRILGK